MKCTIRYSLIFVLGLLVSGVANAGGESAVTRDGSHDFDFEIGTWNIQVKRLLHPLSGSATWEEPTGYKHIVRGIWNGRASIAELEIDRPAPHFAGSMLRLYDPGSHQWRIYWITSENGTVDPPLTGSFANGRGEFFGRDVADGKPVDARVTYSDITAKSFRTTQAFSADGGKTWEPNLIQNFTRAPVSQPAVVTKTNDPDHQHDFDFEFGYWHAHISRLLHPLTGSNAWTSLDGTSDVYELWNGRANFGRLEVANATSAIEGMTLRLYNPASNLWSVYFANSYAGEIGTPVVGRFTNGRGEFHDREPFNGKTIDVRFVFDEITAASFRLVQSFSADGGRSWEPNWIATFRRVPIS